MELLSRPLHQQETPLVVIIAKHSGTPHCYYYYYYCMIQRENNRTRTFLPNESYHYYYCLLTIIDYIGSRSPLRSVMLRVGCWCCSEGLKSER